MTQHESTKKTDEVGRHQDAERDDERQQRRSSYIPVSYEGLGPHGYRRSDENIREEVCSRLTRHGYVDASRISVEVQEGEVILTGTVPNRQMKRMAEDAVETIAGVIDVHNQLRLKQAR
jgi:osmotically-inducible protein OsmY